MPHLQGQISKPKPNRNGGQNKVDTVLGVGVIEDSDAVAIGELDDLAGESVGRGRYGEKYEEGKRNCTSR